MKRQPLFAACSLLALLPSAAVASREEYKTEFKDVAEARGAGWEVIRGDTSKLDAPALSVTEDAVVGKLALRVEAKHPGLWQGIALKDSVDLQDFARIEFYLRQNVHTSGEVWPCAVQIFFEDGGYALADAPMGLGAWTEIVLPLRVPPWTIHDRPQTFGRTTRLRFYPYRELDRPGEFLQIDGLRFVPKEDQTRATMQGVTYRYDTPPDQGADSQHVLLLDGRLSKEEQVTFGPYGADPVVITFDLGEVQTLTRVTLKAYTAPAKNISSVQVLVSEEGKSFTPAASIVNDSTATAAGEQALSAVCLAVGRYVRLELKRPRVDAALVLGEVVLDRRVATVADRQFNPQTYFDGPPMPPVSANLSDDEHYAFLRGARTVVAVHRQTGVVGGLWRANREQVVLRAWDRYVLENREHLTESSEYADLCHVTRAGRRTLVLEGVNHELNKLNVRKEYRLRSDRKDEWLEKVTSFEYTGDRNDQFVTLLSDLAMTESFRKGGYYEGVQVRCDRVCADEVLFKRVIPNSKAVMLVHPGSGETLTQYRLEVDGRFCPPYYTQAQAETYNSTCYNRCGWEIGNATMKLSAKRPASVEVHTALLGDGRFGWEGHFVSLPEYRDYMAHLQRPSWLSEVKAIFSDTYNDMLWGMAARTAERLLSIIDDGYLLSPGYGFADGVWGELPVAGDVTDFFGGQTPSEEVRRMLSRMHENPRFKAGLYMWLQSVNRESEVFKAHPEWFRERNKAGDVEVLFPELKPNFGRILSAPGHEEFLLDQVTAFHKRYPQSVWYLDGGCGVMNMVDWKTLQVSQDHDGQDFCLKVRRRFREISPEGVVFFNEADDRVADIGFAEIGTHFGKDWRTAAASMYEVKVRQYFDPLRLMSPLYLIGSNSTAYLRLCAGLGLPPTGVVSDETSGLLEYAPYCSAAFETRGLQFSPTRLSPNWRADATTPIEMYALRAGRGLVLSVVSHREQEETQELRAQVPADVAKPDETVTVVHHVMEDMSHYKSPVSDFTSKAVYRRCSWAAGAVTELRSITPVKVDSQGWISLNAPLPPETLSLFSIVKSPVFYWSRDGLRANFLLPAVRTHGTTVRKKGNSLAITVTPDQAPVELLVLAPPGQCVTKAKLNGKPTALRVVAIHGMQGTIFQLSQTDSNSVASVHFARGTGTSEQLKISTPASVEAGGNLTVAVRHAPRGPLYLNIWREATLIHADSHAASAAGLEQVSDRPDGRDRRSHDTELNLTLPVPKEAHDGQYTVEVGSDPARMVKADFRITGHQQVEQIPSYWIPDLPTLRLTPLTDTRGDVTFLATGEAGQGGGRPRVDLKSLTLYAEMPNETVSYYNHCHAGIELKGLHSASVRVEHNMFPQRGLYPERHVLLEDSPDAFIGFFVDYAAANGYVKRVALSVGQMSLKRHVTRPDWGKAKPPDHYLRLPSTIYTGEKVEGLLDLARWAPEGWDGRVWITASLDNVFRSRWLSLQLLQLNPLSGSVAPVKVGDVSAAMSRPKDRGIRASRFVTPPTLDGSLEDDLWKQPQPSEGFFVVAKQGQKASQPTEARVGYDDRFLYLGLTCRETEKKGFATTGGAAGTPWWDDSIEFALAPPSWNGRFLHVIVNADAVTYQEIATDRHEKMETSAIPVQCKAAKYSDRFTVEVAVPLDVEGLPAPEPGERWKAQLMRTRVTPSSAREYSTWTASEGYHDFAAFGEVVFE